MASEPKPGTPDPLAAFMEPLTDGRLSWQDLHDMQRVEIAQLTAELSTLRAELERVTQERDAYKKAKAENDERFMLERDAARRELERVKGLCQESLTLFERMDYDHDCPLCNFPRTKGNHTCELTTLMQALAAALSESQCECKPTSSKICDFCVKDAEAAAAALAEKGESEDANQ